MTTVLTARKPEDFLAAVPVLLGFHPSESLVMLTFGASETFHSRLDLPPSGDEHALAQTVQALLGPCLSHGVDHVLFVVYSGDRELAAHFAAMIVPAFVADGIGVVEVLRAHDDHWSSVPVRAGGEETPPTPYYTATHPFTAQAVYDGRVMLASRDELRHSLARDPVVHQRWSALLAAQDESGPADEARARAHVAGWVSSRAGPESDAEAVEVLRVVTRVGVRDALLYSVTRDSASDHLRVWSALLRGAGDAQVPDVAAMTAFSAWQAGHGALAWCALDRCFEVDPRHRLATCLAECLTRAVPPTTWEEAVAEGRPGATA